MGARGLLCWAVLLLCGPALGAERVWTAGTAYSMEKGRKEVGVFGPLRVALKDDLSLEIHPIWALLDPHVGVHKGWTQAGQWTIATRHGLNMPTPLLRFLARPGIGGALAADSVIPWIIATDHQALMSKTVGEHDVVTLWAQLSFALSIGESDYTTVHAPLAYPITTVFQRGVGLNAGIRFDGLIWKKLGYRWAMDVWSLPGADGDWALEEVLALTYIGSDRFSGHLGATLVQTAYPYGVNWHVLPAVDLNFAF